jgi:hypothetical protein
MAHGKLLSSSSPTSSAVRACGDDPRRQRNGGVERVGRQYLNVEERMMSGI